MLRYIKGKCQSGNCKRPAMWNLYHTVAGVKTWKNVCDRCEYIIGDENVRLWAEAQWV
ncbi:hypothetical protein LCGC14_1451810 [marine sediment metagenome]|uniref:Uncharacterized protein n=1 Tax=marine sediment metagenome TaxID=412755 RepID=A0A0F9LYC4_9ZZZZ